MLAFAGCAKPPTEQAAEACQRAGHAPGTAGYAGCFERLLPAYVQAESSRRAASAATSAAMGAAFRGPAPMRMQTNCTTVGNTTNCY
jgi:hypothetical protein